jgi:hypothetical protein
MGRVVKWFHIINHFTQGDSGMKNGLHHLCALFILVLSIVPAYAEPLVLYDSFTSPLIHPDKWIGQGADEGMIVRESVRQVAGRALNMKIIGYSNTASNTGSEIGQNMLIMSNGSLITDIKATVNIKDFGVSACPGNPSGLAITRARIMLPLFNVGTPVSGTFIDDIVAQFRVSGSPGQPDTLSVTALVQRCMDAECLDVQDFLRKELRTVQKNEPVRLEIKWNKANNTITFFHNGKSEVFGYQMPDRKLASMAWKKKLDAQIWVPNCTDEPRPRALMDAVFDNVYVNQSAVASP